MLLHTHALYHQLTQMHIQIILYRVLMNDLPGLYFAPFGQSMEINWSRAATFLTPTPSSVFLLILHSIYLLDKQQWVSDLQWPTIRPNPFNCANLQSISRSLLLDSSRQKGNLSYLGEWVTSYNAVSALLRLNKCTNGNGMVGNTEGVMVVVRIVIVIGNEIQLLNY